MWWGGNDFTVTYGKGPIDKILFQPEIERIVVGSAEKDGKIVQKYVNAKALLKDVAFEEAHGQATGSTTSQTPSGGSSDVPGSGGNTPGEAGGE